MVLLVSLSRVLFGLFLFLGGFGGLALMTYCIFIQPAQEERRKTKSHDQ
jgi:hypothetical protein